MLLAGCGDDVCGPGDTANTGLVASSAEVTLTFGNIVSGQNNDCPDLDAPEGVISLTLEGSQIGGGAGLLTFCIPRPDRLQDGPLPLGLSGVRIIDLNGEADGCTYTFDASRPVSGEVTATGLCDFGANPAGYGLTVDGGVSLRRTCGTTMDTIAVTFDGSAVVELRPL